MATCPNCGMPEAHDGPCQQPAQATGGNPILQGRYELIGQLGQGGMGTVYMARDLRLHNRPCVVKKLRDDFYREEDKQKAVSLFKREAGILSGLQHPHIVHILDYFEESYDYFLVMEYVEGRNLYDILLERGKPFNEVQVLDWSVQICEVLEYLHNHNPPVIYRDLKPSNIMIDSQGRVKLVDFGIARPVEEGADITQVVSAGFSPPEQYWGSADPRSDLYALGGTIYFLLTGKEPLALHVSSPQADNHQVSTHTDMIVRKATTQEINLRFQSASEMRFELKKPLAKNRRTIRLPAIAAGLAILFVLLAASFAYQRLRHLLDLESAQLKASKEELSKRSAEEKELKAKLQAYSNPTAASKDALADWRQNDTQMPDQSSRQAAQITDEEKLTDPEEFDASKD